MWLAFASSSGKVTPTNVTISETLTPDRWPYFVVLAEDVQIRDVSIAVQALVGQSRSRSSS